MLSCPQCFMPLCYESQKHESYEQWRAVHTRCCRINSHKLVRPLGESAVPQEVDLHFQVECAECGAEVGVYSLEEKTYIFFQVIPGRG